MFKSYKVCIVGMVHDPMEIRNVVLRIKDGELHFLDESDRIVVFAARQWVYVVELASATPLEATGPDHSDWNRY